MADKDLVQTGVINLIKPSSGGGGGGGGDVDYRDTTHKPQINGVTLNGNKTSSDLSLVGDIQFNGTSVVTSGVGNITSANIRSVAPACTIITGTTATITANSTYSHKPTTSGLYTVVTPSDNSVYSGFIFQIDTTNSASIAFQTDGTPSATIKINGNVTPTTGKKYTITGQWDVENSSWQLFIIDYSAS